MQTRKTRSLQLLPTVSLALSSLNRKHCLDSEETPGNLRVRRRDGKSQLYVFV